MPKKKEHYHEENDDNLYMFNNRLLDISLYTYANGFDQAMIKFDLCNFPDRDNWKIFLECGSQPKG